MSSLRSIFAPTDRPDLYVIAEAGVNHDGSVADAHALVGLAADCGADAVKFQTFDPGSLVSASARTAAYQAAATGLQSQRDLLEQYVLPTSAWAELRDHANERGIDFLSTAFDLASLDLVCDLGVQALKLGSGELTNRPLLEAVAARGLPVLCSTGMSTLEEVASAVGWLSAAPGLLLMHCVSSYPAPVEQSNLRALVSMREAFERPVGWSDHTVGAVSAVAAVALGAVALEKHVTLDRTRRGPDHAASADAEGFRDYVSQVRNAHAALGDGHKVPAPAEAGTVEVVRRSWHTTRDLRAGDRLEPSDVVLLRPASGLAPAEPVVGRRLVRSAAAGQPLLAEDLEGGAVTARVAVFAATRADLFPLAPVLRTLAGAVDLEVTLLAAGDLAGPASALSDVDLTNVAVRPLGAGLSTHDHRAQARAGERIAAGVADALESLSPDAVVVLGDRWELMYAVPPVVLRGVPLVHLHGGEVTEGAVDDRVRHAVTKLADLHCVSGTQAAARLRQLGEPTDRVVVTGAPGLDHLAEVHAASDDELSRLTGQPVVRPLALVTYHPATAAEEDPGTTAEQVLEATAAVAGTVLVTHPGPERGREAVLAVIEHVAARTPNVSVVPSLGASYLPALAACDVVVGNSSSGIIEAAAFGVPVVDVGARQTGRARGDNVLHAEARQTDIEAAVRTALGADFRERSAHVVNPYGAGGASARVLDVVRRAVQGGLALKPFVDISPGPAA